MLRRVLIVSPAFPPISSADSQRVRMSAPYYRENGWEPVLLTVHDDQIDATREPALTATLPSGLRIERCGALPLALCRLLGLGNLGLRSWFHLFLAGSRLLRREKFDLIFFSNTQFFTFTLGRIWLRLHGVPYVIDLQDPWRTDYYERPGSAPPPGGWKYQLARRQADVLEPWSFRRMSALMSVSDHYLETLARRYAWFSKIPRETIRFGASEADLAAARDLAIASPNTKQKSDTLRLVYTGAAGPITPHATSVLFSAVKHFRDQHPAQAARLRLEFHGTSYAPAGKGVPAILPLAEAHGIADLVHESTDRIGHLESIQLQLHSDALLLLGSSDLAYSPSKLYPYYLCARPILAVVFSQSVLGKLLGQLAVATVVSFSDSQQTEIAREGIHRFLLKLLAGENADLLAGRNDSYFREHFLASTLTQRQCALFDRALNHHATRGTF